MTDTVRIAILGDKYRYEYLRYLLGDNSSKQDVRTESLMKKSIYIVSPGWNHEVTLKAGESLMFSAQVPLYTAVFFPNEDLNEHFHGEDFVDVDRFIVFDETPFHQDSLVANIQKIGKNIGMRDLDILLPKSMRQALKTDITTELDAIAEAKKFYRQMGYASRSTTLEESSGILLYPLEIDVATKFRRSMTGKVEDAERKIKNFLDIDYDFNLEMNDTYFSVNQINSFSSYQSSMRGDLWNSFWERAEAYYFRGNGYELLQDVIAETVHCLFSGTAAKSEAEELKKQLYNAFLTHKRKVPAGASVMVSYGLSEMEYEKKLQATHIDTMFSQQLDHFIKVEMKEICKYYLDSQLKVLKGWMKHGK